MHTHPVNIDLIGVGGGGSLVLSGLVRLHLAMKSLGHPHGLAVMSGIRISFLKPMWADNSLPQMKLGSTKQKFLFPATIWDLL